MKTVCISFNIVSVFKFKKMVTMIYRETMGRKEAGMTGVITRPLTFHWNIVQEKWASFENFIQTR